jgi:hypothetical protein
MMIAKNNVKIESIEKYYNCLVELHKVLNYTNRISLDDFCIKNNISKNLPRVLQKVGIIKYTLRGKYSQWEWTSIEPTKQMAVKSIQMLGIMNPPRKKIETEILKDGRVKNGGARLNSGRKIKQVEIIETNKNKKIMFTLFWGLIKFELC